MSLPGFLRRLGTAAWLGWQVESNWADAFVFAVYSLARPLATALILVAMYVVVAGRTTGDPRFAWLYVGNAFYVFVSMGLVGVGWTVVEDRENYQVLKYIFLSPVGLFTYLAGRSVTKFAQSAFSAAVLLALGALVFHIPFTMNAADAVLGLAGLALGMVGLFGLGWVLAGCGLVFARQSMSLNEGTAAVLYLLCGAIFPIDLLPAALRPLSLALPVTWWLEVMRRALLPGAAAGLMGRIGDGAALGALALTAVAWYAGGALLFRRLERRAKQLGLIDQTTAF